MFLKIEAPVFDCREEVSFERRVDLMIRSIQPEGDKEILDQIFNGASVVEILHRKYAKRGVVIIENIIKNNFFPSPEAIYQYNILQSGSCWFYAKL